MTKKIKLSNGDLAALFLERVRELPGCPAGISLAVVPHESYGWTAIMSPAQRIRYPLFGKRFDNLLTELRKQYDLAR